LKEVSSVESEHLDNDVIVDYDAGDSVVVVEILDFKKRAEKGFNILVSASQRT